MTVEAWSSPDALAVCDGETATADAATIAGAAPPCASSHGAVAPSSRAAARALERGDDPNSNPSSLWNGMIHPLLNMTIRGAIWCVRHDDQ